VAPPGGHNEDFAETRLEIGLIKNKLEHLEETIYEIKGLLKERSRTIPIWVLAISAIPAMLTSLVLLIIGIMIYAKMP
jgi:hypothetical protein